MAPKTHMQFEFADIFCSMAACLLIFGGASLLVLMNRIGVQYRMYQACVWQIHAF